MATPRVSAPALNAGSGILDALLLSCPLLLMA